MTAAEEVKEAGQLMVRLPNIELLTASFRSALLSSVKCCCLQSTDALHTSQPNISDCELFKMSTEETGSDLSRSSGGNEA